MYDSQFAANITTGISEPHANHKLAQKCHELFLQTKERRPLRFQWVKGHSNNKGNDHADAHKGQAQEYCTHSLRWAQPPQFSLTEVNVEKCRKCGADCEGTQVGDKKLTGSKKREVALWQFNGVLQRRRF